MFLIILIERYNATTKCYNVCMKVLVNGATIYFKYETRLNYWIYLLYWNTFLLGLFIIVAGIINSKYALGFITVNSNQHKAVWWDCSVKVGDTANCCTAVVNYEPADVVPAINSFPRCRKSHVWSAPNRCLFWFYCFSQIKISTASRLRSSFQTPE